MGPGSSHQSSNSFASSFLKPDFLLIRQDPRDAGEDFKSALLGFQYGQVPSINSLESVYNFQVVKEQCFFGNIEIILIGQAMGLCSPSWT